MKKIILIIVSMFLLGFSSQATAGTMPYNIGTAKSFLNDLKYFNGYEAITGDYNFTGKWHYTAIGFESGNINYTKETTTGPNSFSTGDTSNFGIWDMIDFSENNLYFEDNDPKNIELANPDNQNYNSFFRLYKLTADSNDLSYLPYAIKLISGTIIVGFNDNGLSGGDSDFDDIIIAMKTYQNPEPATMILLGFGLIGIAGIARRKNHS